MIPTVLILSPAKSRIETSLVDLFNKEGGVNYFCAANTEPLEENFFIEPSLIFIIIDNCCRSDEYAGIEKVNKLFPFTPKIGIVENNSICTDCERLHKLVWSIFIYPFKKEEIYLTINWYCTKGSSLNRSIYSSLKKHAAFDLFKGVSQKSNEIKEKIFKVAQFDVTALITGETGTGKELCAKMIHFLSSREKNAFVPLNCGAVPAELFENELFGHKKGAYTNADSSETGLIAEADKGTLFLDEVESLPEAMQVKLLRFLEEKKYKPLGQSQYIISDVRIIAAAKENLWQRVKENKFREDLFYRLNILNIYLPPLRERLEDIPVLISYFINRFSKLYNKEIININPLAIMKMIHYRWEGNIRELQNVLQEAVIMNSTGDISDDDLNLKSEIIKTALPISTFKSAKENFVSDFERSYLNKLLIIFKGNLTKASRFAQKDRRALGRLLKKYEIDPTVYRKS